MGRPPKPPGRAVGHRKRAIDAPLPDPAVYELRFTIPRRTLELVQDLAADRGLSVDGMLVDALAEWINDQQEEP
jgi:hypothetical protein